MKLTSLLPLFFAAACQATPTPEPTPEPDPAVVLELPDRTVTFQYGWYWRLNGDDLRPNYSAYATDNADECDRMYDIGEQGGQPTFRAADRVLDRHHLDVQYTEPIDAGILEFNRPDSDSEGVDIILASGAFGGSTSCVTPEVAESFGPGEDLVFDCENTADGPFTSEPAFVFQAVFQDCTAPGFD